MNTKLILAKQLTLTSMNRALLKKLTQNTTSKRIVSLIGDFSMGTLKNTVRIHQYTAHSMMVQVIKSILGCYAHTFDTDIVVQIPIQSLYKLAR